MEDECFQDKRQYLYMFVEKLCPLTKTNKNILTMIRFINDTVITGP